MANLTPEEQTRLNELNALPARTTAEQEELDALVAKENETSAPEVPAETTTPNVEATPATTENEEASESPVEETKESLLSDFEALQGLVSNELNKLKDKLHNVLGH